MKKIEKLKNMMTYNKEMAKSINDKLFFLDKLDNIDNLVDFGCADGELLKNIRKTNKNIKLYGIDIEKDEIEEASKNVKTAEFIADNKPIKKGINYKKTGLVLSSVLHEVYNYFEDEEVDIFWSYIKYNEYKYIFIRDMINNSGNKSTTKDIVDKLRGKSKYTDRLKEFEQEWGSINKLKNAIHFLLKYRYEINWKKEISENYLILNTSEIVNRLKDEYKVIHKEEYILPFIKNQVNKDFGINIGESTHIKLILERK